MDIFRKNKKKQQEVEFGGTMQTMTDALGQMSVSKPEEKNDTADALDDRVKHVTSPTSASYNTTMIDGSGRIIDEPIKPGGTDAGIDTLIDSDEDLAEIFNDGDSDDDPGNVSLVSDCSHMSGAEKSAMSPRQFDPSLSSPYGKGSSLQIDPSDVEGMRPQPNYGEDEEEEDASSSGDDGTTSEDFDENDDKSHSDSAEDYTDDEDEGEDGYKPGGYHHVKIGEVFNQR